MYTADLGRVRHRFDDLKHLLAAATPERSGDRLAGLAARSAEERIAARTVLADLPLRHFLDELVVPYEVDEVSHLIIDTHDSVAFRPVAHLTVGAFRKWLLCTETQVDDIAAVAPGITPEMTAGVSKLMRNQNRIAVAPKIRVVTAFRDTLGLASPSSEPRPTSVPGRQYSGRHRRTEHRDSLTTRDNHVEQAVLRFVGMMATKIGLDQASAGSILAAASLCGIPTAMATTVLGQRWPRGALILAGYAAATLAILILTGPSGIVMFTGAALLFKMAWTFIVPYILASMAEIDGRGRLMGVVNLMIGAGLASGPGIAGAVLERGVGLSAMLAGCAATVVGSYLMLALAIRPTSPRRLSGDPAPLAS